MSRAPWQTNGHLVSRTRKGQEDSMLAAWVAGTGSTLIGKSEIGGHATVFHAVVPTSKLCFTLYRPIYLLYYKKQLHRL